jgi:flavodoxin
MLFYFTGTGNSLYVAKKLEQSPISIPQAMHDADKHYRDDSIGVVCPVYGHEMPQMVKDFLKNASFETDFFIWCSPTVTYMAVRRSWLRLCLTTAESMRITSIRL